MLRTCPGEGGVDAQYVVVCKMLVGIRGARYAGVWLWLVCAYTGDSMSMGVPLEDLVSLGDPQRVDVLHLKVRASQRGGS